MLNDKYTIHIQHILLIYSQQYTYSKKYVLNILYKPIYYI